MGRRWERKRGKRRRRVWRVSEEMNRTLGSIKVAVAEMEGGGDGNAGIESGDFEDHQDD